jgi:ATP-dependent Lhr-like helicase
VRTVIVDEIHAVIGTRRGAHLALTLERLQRVAERPLLRLGLSATQKPIEEVAKYLVGCRPERSEGSGRAEGAPLTNFSHPAAHPPRSLTDARDDKPTIVDEGHKRAMDLALELPRSPLEAVMAHEVWEEYYNRLTELIAAHRTTLIFVNTRRMAERVARHLSDRIGSDAVTAHHGSLSKENRLDAETRLKSGRLKALVATASLELGIDIGHVDLVCQIGSPHRIATFLQRVGRSGHTVSGLPKGRLFPVSRDDLVECAALLRAVKSGELDRIVVHDAPLDVLAQQIVAESSCDDYSEDELFALVRRAWPYRELARKDFDDVVKMTADGFATKRGRRGALLHRDEVNSRVRGRRGSRMLAITSGGAIPEVADYRVVLEPDETFIGTLNEDFAIESTAGDIFQLGNASWRITQVGSGVVRVADAKGAPPTIPFWLGEAPSRSDELSRAVASLRADVENAECRVPSPAHPGSTRHSALGTAISDEAAQEIHSYLRASLDILGALPTQDTIIAERFFDESGGMQLVIHAPFGSRINRAWGLALRKRFCRQFNFELQAAATEDALLLSLGPQHSFPLADVFRYLHPATVKDILIQAFLDAPVFQTRWRWNTTIALAVPRNRGGKKVPPQLQRTIADDLMAAVFPDAAACFENIAGDRQIPDHPLVNQAVRDCLEEAMDFDGLARVLERIHNGEIRCLARDTPEPSPLACEILGAKPYAFLDDAPLEERRTQAVYTRRAGDEHGVLDPAAIERVRDEERPDPRDADELHDALLTFGFLFEDEGPRALFDELAAARRATLVTPSVSEGAGGAGGAPPNHPAPSLSLGMTGLWIAAERLPELQAIHDIQADIAPPPSRAQRAWTREEAIIELLRGRLALIGPTTARALGDSLRIGESDANLALLALESEGAVLRGTFEGPNEWCDRRLLARIHRYTLNRLRAEIEPVGVADFMRFLFAWQHVALSSRLTGVDGLRNVIAQLDGFEVAATAWEKFILPSRIDRYEASTLDLLCLTGEVAWARGGSGIALFMRVGARHSCLAAGRQECLPSTLSENAQRVVNALRARGASFARDLDADQETLDELIAAGLVTSDGFLGRRGRWSLIDTTAEPDIEVEARALLQRYGVVFRRLLTREPSSSPWRELARVYRRLEARGEIRGGRFVHGMSGEQFALPDAVARLREIRRTQRDGQLIVISACDPLNLSGILSTEERIRAIPSTRIAWRDGVAVSVLEGDYVRALAELDDAAIEAANALTGRRVNVANGFVGR